MPLAFQQLLMENLIPHGDSFCYPLGNLGRYVRRILNVSENCRESLPGYAVERSSLFVFYRTWISVS